MAVEEISLPAPRLKAPQVQKEYKTGDRHPTLSTLAFVGYTVIGEEVWTSVCGDSEAPFRLANRNGPLPALERNLPSCSSDTVAPRLPRDRFRSTQD